MGLKFDGTVSLGTIITIVSMLVGGIWFAAQSEARLRQIDVSVSEVKGSVDRLGAQVNANVERLDRRIDFIVRQRQ